MFWEGGNVLWWPLRCKEAYPPAGDMARQCTTMNLSSVAADWKTWKSSASHGCLTINSNYTVY